jgi:hypothetical protein
VPGHILRTDREVHTLRAALKEGSISSDIGSANQPSLATNSILREQIGEPTVSFLLEEPRPSDESTASRQEFPDPLGFDTGQRLLRPNDGEHIAVAWELSHLVRVPAPDLKSIFNERVEEPGHVPVIICIQIALTMPPSKEHPGLAH